MNKVCITIVCLGCLATSFAQDIEVKKFESLEKDQTAVTSPRKDINGNTCGLVKVALKEAGAEFEGNVMGDVQFTGSEYLVYLPNGTKRLGIKHPDYLPTTIVFADYGTKRVASSTTYELKVKTNKKKAKVDNSKKGIAVFNIKPSNAMLMIDGQIADGSGGAYTLSLPYGTHYYTVKLKDFSINNQMVKIDKNAKTIDVDLTEFFAKVNVSCKTENAEIIVNGEQKGIGKWEGYIVPGKCVIEARKEGCHLLSRTIELMDSEETSVVFHEMKAITGILKVDNKLNDCEVFLNGENMGKTPWEKEIAIGEYQLEVRHKYYSPHKQTITISEDQKLLVNDDLYQTQFDCLLMLGHEGDPRACGLLAELYLFGIDYVKKSEGWGQFWDKEDNTVYFADRNKLLTEGLSIEPNTETASMWGRMMFENLKPEFEYVESQITSIISEELVIRFMTGENVKQNFKESFYWANRGYGGTMEFWLAWHYFYGLGCEKNSPKALEILDNMRWLEQGNEVPYRVCNKELFLRLGRLAAKQFYWDDRLIKYLERY